MHTNGILTENAIHDIKELHEGVISKLIEVIAAIFRAIINFLKSILEAIFGLFKRRPASKSIATVVTKAAHKTVVVPEAKYEESPGTSLVAIMNGSNLPSTKMATPDKSNTKSPRNDQDVLKLLAAANSIVIKASRPQVRCSNLKGICKINYSQYVSRCTNKILTASDLSAANREGADLSYLSKDKNSNGIPRILYTRIKDSFSGGAVNIPDFNEFKLPLDKQAITSNLIDVKYTETPYDIKELVQLSSQFEQALDSIYSALDESQKGIKSLLSEVQSLEGKVKTIASRTNNSEIGSILRMYCSSINTSLVQYYRLFISELSTRQTVINSAVNYLARNIKVSASA